MVLTTKKNQNPSGDNVPDTLKIVVLETSSTVMEPVVKANTRIKHQLPLSSIKVMMENVLRP